MKEIILFFENIYFDYLTFKVFCLVYCTVCPQWCSKKVIRTFFKNNRIENRQLYSAYTDRFYFNLFYNDIIFKFKRFTHNRDPLVDFFEIILQFHSFIFKLFTDSSHYSLKLLLFKLQCRQIPAEQNKRIALFFQFILR